MRDMLHRYLMLALLVLVAVALVSSLRAKKAWRGLGQAVGRWLLPVPVRRAAEGGRSITFEVQLEGAAEVEAAMERLEGRARRLVEELREVQELAGALERSGR